MGSGLRQSQVRKTLYDQVGGVDGIRGLVGRFYDIVETDPEGEPVHVLHLKGMGVSHLRKAQFEFLCGFLGGPQLYIERNGHSNNKKIHEHIEIGAPEIESWLTCMEKAVTQIGVAEEVGARLMRVFRVAAQNLKNIPD